MKTKRNQISIWLFCVAMLPAVVQAQFTYTNNNVSVTITGYTGGGGAVYIPSTIVVTLPGVGGVSLPVTSIGGDAFNNKSSVTSVTIPASVTSIGNYAFYECGMLGTVYFQGNAPTSVGLHVFDYTSAIVYYLPGTTGWGATFAGRPTVLEYYTYTIPNEGAIITSYTGPGGAVTIPNLINSVVPVISIGDKAFYGRSDVTSVTIPNSVTSIGSSAFQGCTILTNVYFMGNAPSVDSTVFSGDTHAIIYYLPGTTGWGSTFGGAPTWNPQVQTGGAVFGVQTNKFGFKIAGNSNLVVVVESCTNLAAPIWSPLGTNTLTGGSSYFIDPQWTNYHGRFYRLRSP
jgi:hypothetical protein